jgi:nucleotidyltransferase substrate binding protein (TIGR01987 family)
LHNRSARVIDLTSLGRAIAQLEEALAYAGSDLARNDNRLARQFRAAAIQAFEFTYELSYKTLKRFLAETEPNPQHVQAMDFNGTVRLGYARGLLAEEISVWRRFRENRSVTSHTYNEDKAQAVFDAIPRFLDEVRFLFAQIIERQAT